MSSACAPPSSSSAECSFFGGLNASHWEEMDVFRDNFLSLAPHDASSDTCGRSIGDTVLGMQKQQDDSGPVPSEFFAEGAYDGLFAPPANGTEAVLTLTKKQRIGSSDSSDDSGEGFGSGGTFVSFNFDDIPMNEPLQFTINSLRADSCNQDALWKLLDIDSYDISTPQLWYDLLDLLKVTLAAAATQPQLYELVLKVYAYLLLRFEAHQSLEAIAEVLAHLVEEMVDGGGGSAVVAPDAAGIATSVDNRSRLQLSLLCIATKRLPKVLGDCSEIAISVERAILSLFFLLAHGRVCTTAGLVPLLDAIVCCRDRAAVAGIAEGAARLWSPVSVLHHAAHSGLLLVLLQRLSRHFSSEKAASSTPLGAERYLLYAQLYLGFIVPFRHFRGVADVVGSVALLEPFAAHREVLRAHIRSLPIEPVAATNKLVCLIDKSNTLLPLLLGGEESSVGRAEPFYDLFESLCRGVTAIHSRHCAAQGLELTPALSAVVSLLLQSLLHLRGTGQCRGAVSALLPLYDGAVDVGVNGVVIAALADVIDNLEPGGEGALVELRRLWVPAYARGDAVDGLFRSYNSYIMSV